MEEYKKRIKEYSEKNYRYMTRKPEGLLKYPFIVPGSQSYSNCLWDWDSWLTNVAVRQIMKDNGETDDWFIACEKGCILNYLDHIDEDGRIPIFITPKEEFPKLERGCITNIHKPCLAQHAAFIIRENQNDTSWLNNMFHNMECYIQYYKKNMFHKETGLYFWIDDTAVGVDNDPSVFYQPDCSCASIYLNCLMYRELLAMDYIATLLGKESSEYKRQAEELKSAINSLLWDERNGNYYSANLNLKPVDTSVWLHSGMPRHWNSVIQRIDSWSGFMAMWAGIATEEQAKRMVNENMFNSRLFYSNFGICTLAKTEKMYCIVKSGNPSCWLGPIWGISNYICYRGLMNYGLKKQAEDIALKTIRMFGEDLQRTSELHEYYHPDTGEGINNPGFLNWNLLVNNMIAELEGRDTVIEF